MTSLLSIGVALMATAIAVSVAGVVLDGVLVIIGRAIRAQNLPAVWGVVHIETHRTANGRFNNSRKVA